MSKEEMLNRLSMIFDSVTRVQERFSHIQKPEDFVLTPWGVTMLDAISMRLQVIGESIKQIQKGDPSFLNDYPEIDWGKIAKFRDLVSHHYDDVDYEIVYDICKMHIPKLRNVIMKMQSDRES